MKRVVALLLFALFALLPVNLVLAQSPKSVMPGSASSRVTTRSHRSHAVTARSYQSRQKAAQSRLRLKTAATTPLLSQIALAPIGQYGLHSTVSLTPSTPEFTAVDPFRNGLTPSNALKPKRPFWYSVDKNGLTIMGLRTETTGALMVGGPPIHVVENQVVGYVPWPDAIPIAQPDGEVPTDPTVAEDHDKFAWRDAVGGVWEPTGIVVSYPTDEALASTSETPATFVYVVMKHSGYEWQSTPQADLLPGHDPNLRDKIVPQADLTKDSSLLVQVDVSQPDYPVDLFPTGPPIGSGLLGHNAGQPAFDPASDAVYVGNMPSTSLPTTPQVPNDLTSFVSVATLAPGELPAPGEVPAPVTVTVLCGPEHPEVAILAGVPQGWACIAEGGEGPFQWTFTNLPGWLTAHIDPISGEGDGILYGTPTVGTWTFQAHVDDNATTPPGTGDATITLIVTADPSTEYEYGELEWEVGTPAAVAIEGTGTCEVEPTSSTGSIVPAWLDVKTIPGRTINNTALGGPIEHTIGCVVMGTPPISGERYEFHLPNIKFPWPLQNLPVVVSGQVFGPYMFNPLPKDVGLSGLAWHQIDKIHDPSTEADLLNRELFGIEPFTGQLYRILPAYAGLEVEGTVIPPPALEGELDEVSAVGEPLTAALVASRPDIAAILAANPNLKVSFGDLVVEANANPDIYVTAGQISDPTGVDPTVIPIGGPLGSPIAIGAMMKVSGTRDLAGEDPTLITWSAQSTIDLPGVQAFLPALDSDLRPAVRDGSEPGQVDHGVLWVTGTNTGNVHVVDTAAGKYSQLLSVDTATSLGGVSVNPDTQRAYVPGKSLQNVTIFAHGSAPQSAPVIWSANSISFTVGVAGSFTVMATGAPTRPALSQTGAPGWVTFVDNGDGTATLAGTPSAGTEGSYPFTITAANTVSPNATQNFTLIVKPPPPTGPVAVSVTPNTGTATSQIFQAVYSDTRGAAGIIGAFMVINTMDSFGAACATRYDRPMNQFFIINDAGNAWLGPIAPGAAATLQNSQCALHGANSSAVASGNNLTVNFDVSFLPAFVGNKNIYLYTNDTINNLNSGFVHLGTWNLGIPAPVAVSVTPNAGAAPNQLFQAVYSHAAGAINITGAFMVINTMDSFGAACATRYDRPMNQFFIINDAGNAWLGPIAPGAAATLQNSQCVLNGTNSSAVTSGNDLTVYFDVSFLSAFHGTKNIYLYTNDTINNLNSGFVHLGTWTPDAATPVAVSVTPNAGTATNQVFQAAYSDSRGAASITGAFLVINNVAGFGAACATRYDRPMNQFFIINDAGNAWLGPITPGAATTLQNSQCALHGANSSAITSGNDLTVNFDVSFLPAFGGTKNIYLYTNDTINNLSSGFVHLGTWNLGAVAPVAVSVTPNAGSAANQVFQAAYSHAAGAGNITGAFLVINNVAGFGAACATRYDRPMNQFFIINDAGNAWLGPITPGAATTIQNSQCALHGANSSAVTSGNNLTVNFDVSFLPAFAGSKNIYLYTNDTINNLNSGFALLGTWSLP